MAQGANNDYLIFATLENMRRLCLANVIYMDGTFDTAPQLYEQVYTVHCFVGKRLVPMVYMLLSDKTAQTYVRVFAELMAFCATHGLHLQPAEVLTDFETGVIAAVQQGFPGSRHKGCHFHFSQVAPLYSVYTM